MPQMPPVISTGKRDDTVSSPAITVTNDRGVTGAGGFDTVSSAPMIANPTPPSSGQRRSPLDQSHGGAGVIADGTAAQDTLYPPLGSKYDTRLISLERRTGSGIICTSKAVALRDASEYTALSYHWGTGVPSEWIRLNGEKVLIRKTLLEALKMLLYHDITTLWVDSLSIDQDNDDDKGQQVAKMHVIYSHASRVYAWLGPSKSEHDGSDGQLGLKTLRELPADKVNLAEWARKAIQAKEQKSVIGLINREYWTRSWII